MRVSGIRTASGSDYTSSLPPISIARGCATGSGVTPAPSLEPRSLPPSDLKALDLILGHFPGGRSLRQFAIEFRAAIRLRLDAAKLRPPREAGRFVGQVAAQKQALGAGDQSARRRLAELEQAEPLLFAQIANCTPSELRDLRSKIGRRFGDVADIEANGITRSARSNEIPRDLVVALMTRLRDAGGVSADASAILAWAAGIPVERAQRWVRNEVLFDKRASMSGLAIFSDDELLREMARRGLVEHEMVKKGLP